MNDKTINTLLKISSIFDWILDKIVLLILLVSFVFGGYSLYDTWMIYDGANQDEILALKPAINPLENSPEEIKALFKDLLDINSDVVGWISIDKTKIDYPILHGSTNYSYINTNVYGEFALSGSIFLDARNNGSLLDNYSIIYGHHMDNGGMFGELDAYLRQDYLESHMNATYTTLSKIYNMTLFACVECDAYDLDYYTPLTDNNIEHIISKIEKEASTIVKNKLPSNDDKLVAFSTCSTESTNGRIVVFGYFTD